MSATAVKLGSLVIKTLAKPIGNKIKQQAREHARFRRICITFAQQLHRIDMRMRLGLLRDHTATEKAEAASVKKEVLKKLKEGEATHPPDTETVSSVKAVPPDPAPAGSTTSASAVAGKEVVKTPKIRPLSEAKAIEMGANFISEAFLFVVAGSLILYESIRSRRKEANRQDMVTERLHLLEERERQDEVRLEQIEKRNRQFEERILELEEENWKLKGGKGKFPGRERAEKLRAEMEELVLTPLWEMVEKKGTWSKIWNWGESKEEGKDNKAEEKPGEGTSTALVKSAQAAESKTQESGKGGDKSPESSKENATQGKDK
ncbi:hypothetical protein RUND412_003861 [Rhizina undulata]